MRLRNDAFWGLVLCVLSSASCGGSSAPSSSNSADPSNADSTDDAAPSDSRPNASARDASTGTSPGSGNKPTNTATGKKDSGTVAATPDASAASELDAGVAVADSGSEPAGADSSAAPVDIPTPVAAPLIWGFGLGMSDVPSAVKFYTDVMKLTVEKDAIKRDDRTETTLYSTAAMRGARLTLMSFDDKRNTKKITAKVVWQSNDSGAVNAAASKYPGYVSRVDILGVVQFDGPDTYIHEVGGSFDDGGNGKTVPYPIALGFATSDLAAARKFYIALGMTESSVGSFPVTDVNGDATITEYSVKFPDGTGVVLQDWSPKRNAKDNPLKVVMMVPDAKALADKVVAAGGTIVKEAERSPAFDNRLLIVAKDLDGYVLEIVQ